MLSEESFIESNLEKWRALEAYNKTLAKKNISSFTPAEVREYANLSRSASHHLSYAQTYYEGSKCIAYLNQLCGISHSHFYTRDKSAIGEFLGYYTKTFPRMVRKYKAYFFTSFLAMFLGFLFVILLTAIDRDFLTYFLSEEAIGKKTFGGTNETWDYALMSSYIMTNNIRVCAMSVSYGISLGVGTLYILLYNGTPLGALFSLVLFYGADGLTFWSLILPHGFIELTAIFISGTGGLLIGRSMLIPKNLTRRDSLIKGAKEAFYLLPGIATMLVIAGLIEGFFTPLAIDPYIKLFFSFITLILLLLYFYFCGRNKD
ncbi:membrane protein [Clostridia bacterium]|nr:membrane protein [Clostridia bacterium]